MRKNKSGHMVSLQDDISDTIKDFLPGGDEPQTANEVIDNFIDSKEFDTMLDQIIDYIDQHLDEATK